MDIEIDSITQVDVSLDRESLNHLVERLKEMTDNYSIKSGNIVLKFNLI